MKLGQGERTFRARKLYAILGESPLDFGDVFAVARLHGAEDVDAGQIVALAGMATRRSVKEGTSPPTTAQARASTAL